MRLYHFTSEAHLPGIERDGIKHGDVPTSPTEGFDAPWLTTDPDWAHQTWSWGSAWDKTAIRITVEIPDDHPNLYSWQQLIETLNIQPVWVAALENAAGGSMDGHYVYLGGVPKGWEILTERRQPEVSQ